MLFIIYPAVRLQESVERLFAVFLTVLDLQDVVGLPGRKASQSKENLKTTTVLCAKRPESALFHSLVIFSDVRHAIHKPSIST